MFSFITEIYFKNHLCTVHRVAHAAGSQAGVKLARGSWAHGSWAHSSWAHGSRACGSWAHGSSAESAVPLRQVQTCTAVIRYSIFCFTILSLKMHGLLECAVRASPLLCVQVVTCAVECSRPCTLWHLGSAAAPLTGSSSDSLCVARSCLNSS